MSCSPVSRIFLSCARARPKVISLSFSYSTSVEGQSVIPANFEFYFDVLIFQLETFSLAWSSGLLGAEHHSQALYELSSCSKFAISPEHVA